MKARMMATTEVNTMTTMTNGTQSDWADERAIKVARVRRLTDPLGAAGYRDPRGRIAIEARYRRGLFVVVISLYLAMVGALMVQDQRDDTSNALTQSPAVSVQVVSAGDLEPASRPHVRTRSS
jgi:hypothetical protein